MIDVGGDKLDEACGVQPDDRDRAARERADADAEEPSPYDDDGMPCESEDCRCHEDADGGEG